MKPILTRAVFFVALLTPIQIVQANGHVVVTVANPVQSVYVTSTAEPVFVTVTRDNGSNRDGAVDLQSSPIQTPPSQSPVTPPSQTPVEKKISVTPSVTPSATPSVTPGVAPTVIPSLTPSQNPSVTPSATKKNDTSKAPSTTPTPTPNTGNGNGGSGNPASFTIAITNSYGVPLSLALGSNDPGPTPDGNPQPTVIDKASATTYTFPTGWAGRISIGKTLCGSNTLIEGSFPGDSWNSLDISYVDGYSVPITCSVNGNAVTGCNIDLFNQQGITCASPVDNGAACHNTAGDNGPAVQFFKACAGAAYTYPKDDTATNGSLQGRQISCCIGTSCPKPQNQKSSYKRNVDDVLSPPAAHAHQHLARHHVHHHARSQVHQLVQEAKLRRWFRRVIITSAVWLLAAHSTRLVPF